MALRRKQQKLLGFGTRLQSADVVSTLAREKEVCQALECLHEVYGQQRQLQDARTSECTAVLDVAKLTAKLTRRRGQVIESFGHREHGEWVLDPAEVLYLAERGTLSVYLPGTAELAPSSSTGKGESGSSLADDSAHSQGGPAGQRPLRVQELYALILGANLALPELYALILGANLALPEYNAYAHLRRAGCFVESGRPEPAAADAAAAAAAAAPAEGELRLRRGGGSGEWLLLQCGGEARCAGGARAAATAERRWVVQAAASSPDASSPRTVRVVDPDEEFIQVLDGIGGKRHPQASHFSNMIMAVAQGSSGCNPAFLEFAAPVHPKPPRAQHEVEAVQAPVEGNVPDTSAEAVQSGGKEGNSVDPLGLEEQQATSPDAVARDYAALRERWAGLAASAASASQDCAGKGRKRPRSSEGEEAWLL